MEYDEQGNKITIHQTAVLMLHESYRLCVLYLNPYCSFFIFFFMQKMVNGARVRSWLCVNFARNVQESMATGFCRELARMCQASGMASTPEMLQDTLFAHCTCYFFSVLLVYNSNSTTCCQL